METIESRPIEPHPIDSRQILEEMLTRCHKAAGECLAVDSGCWGIEPTIQAYKVAQALMATGIKIAAALERKPALSPTASSLSGSMPPIQPPHPVRKIEKQLGVAALSRTYQILTRGAPKGNQNALKTGAYVAAMRDLRARCREIICEAQRLLASYSLELVMPAPGVRAKRGPRTSSAGIQKGQRTRDTRFRGNDTLVNLDFGTFPRKKSRAISFPAPRCGYAARGAVWARLRKARPSADLPLSDSSGTWSLRGCWARRRAA